VSEQASEHLFLSLDDYSIGADLHGDQALARLFDSPFWCGTRPRRLSRIDKKDRNSQSKRVFSWLKTKFRNLFNDRASG